MTVNKYPNFLNLKKIPKNSLHYCWRITLEGGITVTDSEDVHVVHQAQINQYLIYCFSSPKSNKVEYLPTKFGKYILKINELKKFVDYLKNQSKVLKRLKLIR